MAFFFVAGITGKVGGAAARHLLSAGHTVRSLARDPAKAEDWTKEGVEIIQATLEDTAALARAFAGVDGAFLLTPPNLNPSQDHSEAKALAEGYRKALEQTPPPRLVVLSSVGSQQTSGLGLITSTHLLEEALRGLAIPTAFVRAGSFFENYLYGLEEGSATGVFHVFHTPTSRPLPMVATADIGQEVARLLTGAAWAGTRVVELGSHLTPDELAKGIEAVVGRPVRAESTPHEHWDAAMSAMGLPPNGAKAFAEMEDGINSGWIDFGVPGAESVPATTTPAEFFRKAQHA